MLQMYRCASPQQTSYWVLSTRASVRYRSVEDISIALVKKSTYWGSVTRLYDRCITNSIQLNALVANGIVESYPPLVDKKGSYTAQFEHVRLFSIDVILNVY